MIFAVLLFAAITTEQNDLFTTTADYATFSTNSGGIASQWIPYGTYTDGSGSTEYLRVTSNLIGVVASVFDGCEERDNLPGDYLPEDLGFLRYIYYPTPQLTNTLTDTGEYLRITNNTLRILDAIDSNSYIYYSKSGSNYTYSVGRTEPIETKLARSDSYQGEYHHNSGLSARFGGRRLDYLVGELGGISPPIGTSWSADLPFQVGDIDSWALTWPAYSALTNDIHFYHIPATTTWHRCERPFMDWTDPAHLVELWGSDVNVAAEDVVTNTLPICLPITLEDVLKVDPGWKYEVPPRLTNDYWTIDGHRLSRDHISGNWDDLPNADSAVWSYYYSDGTNEVIYILTASYDVSWTYETYDFNTGESVTLNGTKISETSVSFQGHVATKTEFYSNQDDFEHWRNGTKRLDWKRLGILCQLERQMETTYLARDDEDYLPFIRTTSSRDHLYTGSAEVSFLDGYGDLVATTNIDLSAVQWSLTSQIVQTVSATNGWCFPTARLEGTYEVGIVSSSGATGGSRLYADPSTFDNAMRTVANNIVSLHGLSDGTLDVEISGELAANGLNGFSWTWTVDYVYFHDAGGDMHDYQSYTSYTESFAGNPPTTAAFNLIMDVGKRAATMQTDGEAQTTTITNFVHYPITNIWNRTWVSEQDRPSLDVMLDAKGYEFENYAAAYGDSPMPWDEIKDWTNKVRRVFRMSPFSASKGNLEQSDINRWQMLSKLDEEVKDRFEELAGMAVGNAAQNLAQFVAGEEAALKAQLSAQPLLASLTLGAGGSVLVMNESFVVDQTGQVNDGTINSVFWVNDTPPYYADVAHDSNGYWIGTWDFSSNFATLTNAVFDAKPVRVDGHQDQIIKTLWKFKNLRDPTL